MAFRPWLSQRGLNRPEPSMVSLQKRNWRKLSSRLLTNGHFPYPGGIRPHPHDQPQNQSLQPFEDTSEVEADGGHFDVEAVA